MAAFGVAIVVSPNFEVFTLADSGSYGISLMVVHIVFHASNLERSVDTEVR
jgi:hypothetical protein